MYENYDKSLEAYWKQSIQLNYMDADCFVLSFDANQEILIEFSKRIKDESDFRDSD